MATQSSEQPGKLPFDGTIVESLLIEAKSLTDVIGCASESPAVLHRGSILGATAVLERTLDQIHDALFSRGVRHE